MGSNAAAFFFIDDAIDAILLLFNSDHRGPVNIGSDHPITIYDLARLAIDAVGLSTSAVEFRFDALKPTGVGSRNSDNALVKSILGWSPQVTLKEGVVLTTKWIREE